ncbi:MAG: DUF4340 domain-containing protein [Myxococcota bacterium]
MSSTAKKLIAAGGVFGILLVLVLVLSGRRAAEEEEPPDRAMEGELPSFEQEKVTELEIRRPEGGTKVVLVRTDGGWRLSEPLDADANDGYVEMALERLASLEESVTGIAATRAENHDRLEVAESNGIQVFARAGDDELLHLFVGAYKGGSTMVRLAGEEAVHAYRGSIKSSFNRDVSDWREKRVVDETAADVHEVRFESDNGTFHLVRGEDGDWQPAEDQSEIEDFSASRVQSLVSTLARMRAADFAEPEVEVEEAGVGESASSAILVLRKGDEETEDGESEGAPTEERIVLRLGNALEGDEQFYLRREGREPIYVVSKFLAERIAPSVEKFQPSEEPEGQPPQGKQLQPGGKGKQQLTQEQMDQLMKQIQKTPIKLGGAKNAPQ